MKSSTPLGTVIAALERRSLRFRQVGDQVDAQCSAHEDANPSLSVTYDAGAGKVLVNCHVGCSPDDVVAALGLTWPDLFDPRPDAERQRGPRTISAVYPYTDELGEVLFEKVRYNLGTPKYQARRPDGRGGYVWKLEDVRRVLYRLPELRAAIAAQRPIVLCEGEKDADRVAEQLGLAATTNTEGAAKPGQRSSKWLREYTGMLRGARVWIVADNDEPGIARGRAILAALDGVAAEVKLFRPAVDTAKADMSDHLDAGHGIEDLVPVNVADQAAADGVDAEGVDVHVHPNPPTEHATPTRTGSPARMPILPEDFWSARPELAHIRRAAYSRLASADLVLHAVLAKLASMSSHELVFDSGRGKSSLNYFCAVVGASGIGKTSGVTAVDDQLLRVPRYLQTPPDLTAAEPFYDGLPLGSGEGIAEAFMGMTEVEVDTNKRGDPIMKKVRAMVRHNVLVVVDEGETFTRLGERTGATVSTTLRSAWVGATIGQANGRDDTTRIVRANSYSLGMVVGFQPHTALPLLLDTATGTAQRFSWVSAADRNLPDEHVDHPGPLEVPSLVDQEMTARTGTMRFPDSIVAELRQDHIAKIRGELVVDEHNSQGPLMRVKMAALLALLNGRHDAVTVDDWDLAATMWETSCRVRDHVTEHGAAEKARQAELVAEARVQLEERKAAAVNGVDAKLDRLAVTLADRVVESGGMKRGDARRGMPSRDRHLYEQVVERAMSNGLLRTVDGGGVFPPMRAA